MPNIVEMEGPPDEGRKGTVIYLFEEIFSTPVSEKVITRLHEKTGFLLLLALDDDGWPIGFKLGYDEGNGLFYSWLGGVLAAYRGQGIARLMMDKQHEWCAQKGYHTIRTKTMNKWRNMLVLNIRSGFDIVDVYRKDDGEERIVLEKRI